MRSHSPVKLLALLVSVFLLISLTSAMTAPAEARIWNVNVAGTGDVPTIQAAIDSAGVGDEIVVAPGTYGWAAQGHNDDYGMIYFETYVSGFTLRSSHGPEVTILDAEFQGRVMFIQGHNDIVVDGFTMINGVAPMSYDGGGGLIGHLADPVIRNCIFTDNSARQGGALWFGGVSSPVIENCTFHDNTAYYGGAVFLINSSNTGTIRDCVIRNNYAEGRGGGIIVHNYRFDLLDTAVYGNTCDGVGGAISISETEPGLIKQCTLTDNLAPDGGGIQVQGNSTGIFVECTIISHNSTGGAISLWEGTSIELESCILWQNVGGDSIPPGGVDGGNNFVLDPQFCGTPGSGNLKLQSDSPCLVRNHPVGFLCSRIGAFPPGCGTVGTETRSWGSIRKRFR